MPNENNKGTLVASTVRPAGVNDTFAVAQCNEILGGLHIVNTVEEMFSIPQERRMVGMHCTVTGEDDNFIEYILITNPDSPKTTLVNWKVASVNSANVTISIPSDTGGNKSVNLSELIKNIRSTVINKNFMYIVGFSDLQVGPCFLELPCIYNMKLIGVDVSIPDTATINSDITIEPQVYNGGMWNTVGSVTITNDKKSATLALPNPKEVDPTSKVRLNLKKVTTDAHSINAIFRFVQTGI